MQIGSPTTPSRAARNPAPEIIFANWREMLNRLLSRRGMRHSYTQVIERYLDYLKAKAE